MNTAEQSCGAFLDALASKAPVPGGGGASALAGALARPCVPWLATTPWASKNTPRGGGIVNALMARAEDLRARLLGLVDTDAAAFEPLSPGLRHPEGGPEPG